MRELQRRLRAHIAEYYGGVPRQMSRALGPNPHLIQDWLDSPAKLPTLDKLAALADLTGWRLGDIVCWALGREPEAAADETPDNLIVRGLDGLGVRAADQAVVLTLAHRLAAAPSGPAPDDPPAHTSGPRRRGSASAG